MRTIILILPLIAFSYSSAQIRNYLFIGMDRDQLKNTSNWAVNGLFEGVQVAYSWRQLEPQRDHYDFILINEDLKLLERFKKKLFIQIQDASFQMRWNFTPTYILKDSIYNGGANKQYRFNGSDEKEFSELGWVTRRWDKEVQKRLHKLYDALGKQFDGIVEGINTEETSVTFGNGPLHPPGFSFEGYKDAIIENLAALKKAFPKSIVIAYANFMPGGYLPSEDTSLLKAVYEFSWANHIGVGGPDLLPYKPGQMNNSYRFIKDSYRKVPTGVAVQDGTYRYINPQTQKPITAKEIYQFAEGYLHLNYIFWGREEPFFRQEVVPLLTSLTKDKN